jgi:hypothetical protein
MAVTLLYSGLETFLTVLGEKHISNPDFGAILKKGKWV